MKNSSLLKVLRRLVNRCGFDLRRHPISYDPDHVRQQLLTKIGVGTVLDVGANAGQYGELLLRHGFQGRVISFEPVAQAFRQLSKKCEKSNQMWIARQEALGAADGTVEINVSGTMSSILSKSASASQAVNFSVDRMEKVPLRRLESIWEELKLGPKPVWLKMDVQGYESAVLDGAHIGICEIAAVEMEMSLWPFYEGQVLYREMVERMHSVGFDLWSISPGSRDPSGQMVEMDGIFVNRSRATKS